MEKQNVLEQLLRLVQQVAEWPPEEQAGLLAYAQGMQAAQAIHS